MSSERTMLVILPHCDDETYSIGGFIAKRALEGWKVDAVVAGVGGDFVATSPKQRWLEFLHACDVLGITGRWFSNDTQEMWLERTPMVAMVSWLDSHLAKGYEEVYYPYPSDNQDHQYVYRAVQAALRHTAGQNCPTFQALYEYPRIGITLESVAGGRCYIDITGEPMEKKRIALKQYQSQLKPWPSLGSLEAVERLAKMRGMECGVDAAELVYVQRMKMA